MSLFFNSEKIPHMNVMEKIPKNRAVFLDVKPKTPGFEKDEDGIKYINFASYPPVPIKNAFEDSSSRKVKYYSNLLFLP